MAIAIVTYSLARLRTPVPQMEFGRVLSFDGRVQMAPYKERLWRGLASGDILWTETQIKTSMNASLQIQGRGRLFNLGPDSHITLKSRDAGTVVTLHSGELQVDHSETLTEAIAETIVETDEAAMSSAGQGTFILTRPVATPVTIVRAVRGTVRAEAGKTTYFVGPDSDTLVLGRQDTKTLWNVTPVLDEVFPSKEGFAAIHFSWKTNHSGEHAQLLLRNLIDGNLRIFDTEDSAAEITLPVGSYSWDIKLTGGAVSTSRRFQISGDPSNSMANRLPTSSPQSEISSAIPPNLLTNPPETTTTEQDARATTDTQVAPNELSDASSASSDEVSADAPQITIVSPAKESQIPLQYVTETRVKWKTKGKVKFIEFDLVASSGNPSMRFVLPGRRTRRRLPEIPPGRYTVRIRAASQTPQGILASEWSETYFDVIQTTPGELAPSNVKAEITTHKKQNYLVIEWSKSTAPQYQITILNPSEPTKILHSEKSKLVIPASKSNKLSVTVCALDANQQVRGCAPTVKTL